MLVDLFANTSNNDLLRRLSSLTLDDLADELIVNFLDHESLRQPQWWHKSLHFLLCARKGMSRRLYAFLVDSFDIAIDDPSLQRFFNSLPNIAIVKSHPWSPVEKPVDASDTLYFLHDQVYFLYDRLLLKLPERIKAIDTELQNVNPSREEDIRTFRELRERRDVYKELFAEHERIVQSIVDFYREQFHDLKNRPNQRRLLEPMLLHYELLQNIADGYRLFAQWSEQALTTDAEDVDLHMQLREEVLFFVNRYCRTYTITDGNEVENPLYSPEHAKKLPPNEVQRDFAVQWIKRHLARRNNPKAVRAFRTLRKTDEPLFDMTASEIEEDVIYRADLLTVGANALLYAGDDPEDEGESAEEYAEKLLLEVVELLDINDDSISTTQRWWYARILGRAYNNLGYLYRLRGSYEKARNFFELALKTFHYSYGAFPAERSNTLNNQAYLLALLGDMSRARDLAERALHIRENLGEKIPQGLSSNTLGRIYCLHDYLISAETASRNALKIFSNSDDPRGQGLAHNALGFIYRKRANQWKQPERGLGETPERYFEDAEMHLNQALDIFSKPKYREPSRLWETYNELGSLYCDWGWYLAQQNTSGAQDKYAESIDYQNSARQIAKAQKLHIQELDSIDDLAQVNADFYFLLRNSETDDNRMETAENLLRELESNIPKSYKSGAPPENGHIYSLLLGKANLQRAIWKFVHNRPLQRIRNPESLMSVKVFATFLLLRFVFNSTGLIPFFTKIRSRALPVDYGKLRKTAI